MVSTPSVRAGVVATGAEVDTRTLPAPVWPHTGRAQPRALATRAGLCWTQIRGPTRITDQQYQPRVLTKLRILLKPSKKGSL